jgi:hypothetical protein
MAVPRLAAGGMVRSETLALVGDNLNAAADPEVVTPLSKLQSILNNSITTQLQEFSQSITNRTLNQVMTTATAPDRGGAFDLDPVEVDMSVNIEVIGRLSGDDIYLANKRAETKYNRKT